MNAENAETTASWKETLAEFREVEAPAQQSKPEGKPGRRKNKTLRVYCNRLKQIWKNVPGMSLAEMIAEAFTEDELVTLFPGIKDELLLKRLGDRYGR